MAVGVAHLGRQVRCPHCQAVVMAPAAEMAAAPPSADPGPHAASNAAPQDAGPFAHLQAERAEAESIFAPPPESDDLFGGTAVPRLELPPPRRRRRPGRSPG
jgi:hypothetical protein